MSQVSLLRALSTNFAVSSHLISPDFLSYNRLTFLSFREREVDAATSRCNSLGEGITYD